MFIFSIGNYLYSHYHHHQRWFKIVLLFLLKTFFFSSIFENACHVVLWLCVAYQSLIVTIRMKVERKHLYQILIVFWEWNRIKSQNIQWLKSRSIISWYHFWFDISWKVNCVFPYWVYIICRFMSFQIKNRQNLNEQKWITSYKHRTSISCLIKIKITMTECL